MYGTKESVKYCGSVRVVVSRLQEMNNLRDTVEHKADDLRELTARYKTLEADMHTLRTHELAAAVQGEYARKVRWDPSGQHCVLPSSRIGFERVALCDVVSFSDDTQNCPAVRLLHIV